MRLTKNGDFWLILGLALVLTGFHYGNELKAELGSAFNSVSQRIAAARDAISASDTAPRLTDLQSPEQVESQPTQFIVIRSTPQKAYEYRGCH